MNNEQRQRLSRMQVDFVKSLHDVEGITDYLLSLKILSRAQSEQILLSGPTIPDKVRALLSTLVRCGPNAYDAFISALNNTNQASLADKMRSLVIDSPSLPPISSLAPQRGPKPTDYVNRFLNAYPVNSSPCGYILLVNVSNFGTDSGLSNRLGSSEDVAALKSLFTDLGYFVEVLIDPNSIQLESSLKYFSIFT